MADLNRQVTAGLQGGGGGFSGLLPSVLNVLEYMGPMPYKVSATNAVFTSQTLSSTMNVTTVVGTNVDFPRNLVYQLSLTNGSASSAMISGGTFYAAGTVIGGRTASETVALSALASMSVASQGAVIFQQVGTLSFSNFSLATASSSASNSVSFSVGIGNKVGSPWAIKQNGLSAPSPVDFGFIGTSIQTTLTATASTSNNVYTIITGSLGIAAVQFSNALATNTPVGWMAHLNR